MSLTKLRTIWGAILFSTLFELAVVLESDFDRHVELQHGTFFGLVGAVVVLTVASFVLPRRLYREALARLALSVTEVPVQEGASIRDYRSPAGSERVFRDPPTARDAALRAFQAPFIVGIALADATAIIGFMIAIERVAPSFYALPFFALAWLLLGLRYPRIDRVIGPAERAYSAKLP
ncbi:hypothetical protein BH09MYX1_BH09MYX1_56350 [soil metagenome]